MLQSVRKENTTNNCTTTSILYFTKCFFASQPTVLQIANKKKINWPRNVLTIYAEKGTQYINSV